MGLSANKSIIYTIGQQNKKERRHPAAHIAPIFNAPSSNSRSPSARRRLRVVVCVLQTYLVNHASRTVNGIQYAHKCDTTFCHRYSLLCQIWTVIRPIVRWAILNKIRLDTNRMRDHYQLLCSTSTKTLTHKIVNTFHYLLVDWPRRKWREGQPLHICKQAFSIYFFIEVTN